MNSPAARALAAAAAFHAAYWVIFAVAALGALIAAIAFPRRGAGRTVVAAPSGDAKVGALDAIG